MKRLFTLTLAIILSISCMSVFVGCNGEDEEPAGPQYEETYTYDETHHWRNEINGEGYTDYGEHDDDRGKCICGLYYDYTEYLTFERITEKDKDAYDFLGDGYKITDFNGFEFDSPLHIEIPATYQGEEDEEPLPVLMICDNVFSPSRSEGLIAIESVKFNEGLTHIMHSSFAGSAITEVSLPDSMKYLQLNAFAGNLDLKKFYSGNGLKGFRDYTFSGCVKLEEVILGENFREIRQRDFYGCKSLKQIVLPKSFVSIPEDSIGVPSTGIDVALIEALAGLSDVFFEISEAEYEALLIEPAKRDPLTGHRWYSGTNKKGEHVEGYFNIYNFKYVLWADTTYGIVKGCFGKAKLHFDGEWHYDEDGKPVAN